MTAGSINVDVNVQSVVISPAQFSDWLKGFLDATGGMLTIEQVDQIKQKLAAVSPYAGWLCSGVLLNPCAAPPCHFTYTLGTLGGSNE